MPPPETALMVTPAKVPSTSLKPRSTASIRRKTSSSAVIVALVPEGASALSSATLTVETATLLGESPSVTVTLIVRETLVPPAVGSSPVFEKVTCSIAAAYSAWVPVPVRIRLVAVLAGSMTIEPGRAPTTVRTSPATALLIVIVAPSTSSPESASVMRTSVSEIAAAAPPSV